MADDAYVSVRVPATLGRGADKLAEKQYRGYRSRSEVVTDALRRLIEEAETRGVA